MSRAILILMFVPLLFFFVYINSASEQVLPKSKLDVNDLFQYLDKLESQIKILECNVHFREFQVKKALDEYVDFSEPLPKWIEYGEPQKTEKEVVVLIEPETGRLNIKDDSITPGSLPGSSGIFYSRSRNELAFDGTIRAEYHNHEGLPPDIAPSVVAIINKGPLTINDKRGFFNKGLDVFLSCYQGDGLKQYIHGEKIDVNSIEGRFQADGILEVSFKDDRKHKFLIDIEKGGAILSSEHFSTINDNVVVWKTETSWIKNEEDYWVPESTVCVSGNTTPTIDHWKYEQVKINHIKPGPEMFRLNFPEGTEIFDHARNIVYIADTSNTVQSKTLTGQTLPDITDIGIDKSSADVNDKTLLFCFFDIEQRPSRNCVIELNKRVKELKSKDVEIIAVHASKIKKEKLNEWVKENSLDFLVGMIKENEEQTRFNWCVRALPWLILTDKEHVVTDEGFSIDDLVRNIRK